MWLREGTWIALCAAVILTATLATADGVDTGNGLVVGGRLVDADGMPLDSTTVHLLPFGLEIEPDPTLLADRATDSSRTDAQGFFELTVPERGTWEVTALVDGSPHSVPLLPFDRSTQLPPLVVPTGSQPPSSEPEPGARCEPTSRGATELPTVRGVVYDEDSDEPLEGALVWTEPCGEFTTTDSQGIYSLRVRATERFEVGASAPGFFRLRLPSRPTPSPGWEGPTFGLYPASGVSGSVVAPSGWPWFAEVTATPVDPGAARRLGGAETGVTAFTGSDGSFSLFPLAPGIRYRVDVSAPGAVPTSVEISAPPAQRSASVPPVLLEPRRSARGRVMDSAGRPVGEAEILLLDDPGDLPFLLAGRADASSAQARTTSDRSGHFVLQPVSPGPHTLFVRAAGYEPMVVPGVVVADSRSTDLGSVDLEPEGRLEVTVVNTDGDPLPGARLTAVITDPAGDLGVPMQDVGGITDEEGLCALTGVPRRRPFDVTVHRAGFLPKRVRGLKIADGDSVRIELQPAAAVRGTVVEMHGPPVEGARVTARREDSQVSPLRRESSRAGRPASTVTDAEGAFHLADLEAGETLLTAHAPGFVSRERSLSLIAGETVHDVELVLERGATVSGVVSRPDGTTVPAAIVVAQGKTTTTEPDGSYELRGFAPGVHRITGRHPDLGTASREVSIPPGAGTLHLDLTLEQPGFLLTGTVVRSDGPAAAGATVRAEGLDHPARRSTTADGDGGFELPLSRRERYRLSARLDGFGPTSRIVDVAGAGSSMHVELVLEPGARLRGEVYGADPLDLGQATVHAEHRTHGRVRGRIAFSGSYRVDGLSPGQWTVVVELADGRSARSEVEIEPSQTEAWADLELGSGATLTGSLTIDGKVVAGAPVTLLRSDSWRTVARTTTRHDGTFSLSGLVAAPHRLRIASPAGEPLASRTVDLATTDEVRVVLKTGGLRARVVDRRSGRGLGRATVAIEPVGTGGRLSRTARAQADGSVVVVRLPEGDWRLTARVPGYQPESRRITIAPGSSVETRIPLGPEVPPDTAP